ncbi:SIMPL domain-containing protein [Ruania halotolerans]|uniref:SIMPL domain-containing protein n=1 Tax=Ruania halotolerans TaxID=2897773 RepID=UPI001E55B898|nr:SIMPL domain-containing protein [Ruania halotolerans]UFU05961.1 SIMPL domain-containing protein [Ruania halotolerans]
MTTFSVHGTATRSLPPERAQLHLLVGFEGTNRGSVLNQTLEAHRHVTDAARRHQDSGAATWWGADRVQAAPFKEYVKDSKRTITKFRSSASVTVRFLDFGVLAEWVAQVGTLDGVSLGGVTWELTQRTRREMEKATRVDAVRDAVVRAGDYAAALGLAEPRLVAVFEPGLRPNAGAGPPSQAFATRGAPAPAGASADLKAGDVDINAEVTADFVSE